MDASALPITYSTQPNPALVFGIFLSLTELLPTTEVLSTGDLPIFWSTLTQTSPNIRVTYSASDVFPKLDASAPPIDVGSFFIHC